MFFNNYENYRIIINFFDFLTIKIKEERISDYRWSRNIILKGREPTDYLKRISRSKKSLLNYESEFYLTSIIRYLFQFRSLAYRNIKEVTKNPQPETHELKENTLQQDCIPSQDMSIEEITSTSTTPIDPSPKPPSHNNFFNADLIEMSQLPAATQIRMNHEYKIAMTTALTVSLYQIVLHEISIDCLVII